jgi:DTW domain-containing protein YfiP
VISVEMVGGPMDGELFGISGVEEPGLPPMIVFPTPTQPIGTEIKLCPAALPPDEIIRPLVYVLDATRRTAKGHVRYLWAFLRG